MEEVKCEVQHFQGVASEQCAEIKLCWYDGKMMSIDGRNFQGVASEQCAEIKRLRNEINRLSMFRSTVRNYQEQNSEEQEVIPSDMLTVSYNNEWSSLLYNVFYNNFSYNNEWYSNLETKVILKGGDGAIL